MSHRLLLAALLFACGFSVSLAGCTVRIITPTPDPLLAATAPQLELIRVSPTAPAMVATDSATATPQPALPTDFLPTPDPTRIVGGLPELGDGWYALYVTVQPGEDIGILAARYGVTYDQMRTANALQSGQVILAGTVVIVPQRTNQISPSAKLLPDSELVYGPAAVGFDIAGFVRQQRGYLFQHRETVGGRQLRGDQIVQQIAETYSINPRLLLAFIEYQSGWVNSSTRPTDEELAQPLGVNVGRSGLHGQLTWLASRLNHYFYNWRGESLQLFILSDGRRVAVHPELNAGTVAIQGVLAELYPAERWLATLRRGGLTDEFTALFGSPFTYAVEPLVPDDLTQPELSFPWSEGQTWYYVGGPHASFGTGTPWGAIDFAPPDDNVGCYVSAYPVLAAAGGVVARTDFGLVEVDLDGDGHFQTGWSLVYLHLENRTKVGQGFVIEPNGYIGYPSCDGGLAEGTHLHLARKYNGVWLNWNDPPFLLEGWQVGANDAAYSGWLFPPPESVIPARQACDCRNMSVNGLTRD